MKVSHMLFRCVRYCLPICFASVAMLVLLIFVDAAKASTQAENKTLLSAVINAKPQVGFLIALQAPGGQAYVDDEPFYTNPFYIFGALLVLALGVEIYVLKRKRDKEKLEKEQSKKTPQSQKEQPDLKRKKKPKYGKDQMSELLKATATHQKNGKKETFENGVAKPNSVTQNNSEPNQIQPETLDEESIEVLDSLETEVSSDVFVPKAPPTKEPLPTTVDDITLYNALVDVMDDASSVRAVAVRDLARYKTQNAVAALSKIVLEDEEEIVRCEAVKSLKAIAHDSAFIPLFIAVSDDSQQVRAAAAEALKHWPSERADNYLELIESGDERLIERAAEACVKTKLFKQALSHLNSQNPKHSKEAFALLSILAKAGVNEPLLKTLEEHYDSRTRVLLIRLLTESNRPESQEELRALASREDLPKEVREEIMQSVASL